MVITVHNLEAKGRKKGWELYLWGLWLIMCFGAGLNTVTIVTANIPTPGVAVGPLAESIGGKHSSI